MINELYGSIWYDICYYEVYRDKLSRGKYLEWLSYRYNLEINELMHLMAEVKESVEIEINKHKEREKGLDYNLRTESKFETVKSYILEERMEKEKESKYSGGILLSDEELMKINNFGKPRIYRKR